MKNFTDGYDDFEENGTSIVTYTVNGVNRVCTAIKRKTH